MQRQGFQFKKSTFDVVVEGKTYTAEFNQSVAANLLQEILAAVEAVESDVKANISTEQEGANRAIEIVKEFIDKFFGENTFNKMTEGYMVDMFMAIELFRYICECYKDKVNQRIADVSSGPTLKVVSNRAERCTKDREREKIQKQMEKLQRELDDLDE